MQLSQNSTPVVLAVIAGLCAQPHTARAEFAWEISGSAGNTEIGDVNETDAFAIGATYHFGEVDDSLGPYSLAAFLDRSSRLSVSAIDTEERSEFVVSSPFTDPILNRFEFDTSGYALSGRYVWRESGWYVGAGGESSDTDWPPSDFSMTDSSISGYHVLGGKYLGRSTTLDLSFRSTQLTLDVMQEERPSTLPLPPLPAISSRNETTTDAYELRLLHVGDIGRMSYGVSAGVESSQEKFEAFSLVALPDPEDAPVFNPGVPIVGVPVNISPRAYPVVVTRDRIDRVDVGFELFPTMAIGVRIAYARWNHDPTRNSHYELAASWFFKRSIGARLALSQTNRDSIPVESLRHVDGVTLELLGRF